MGIGEGLGGQPMRGRRTERKKKKRCSSVLMKFPQRMAIFDRAELGEGGPWLMFAKFFLYPKAGKSFSSSTFGAAGTAGPL